MSEKLGNRIALALQEKLMTQKELADKVGVTEAVISRYISGTREPKPDMLANIATALGTTSDYLLDLNNELKHSDMCRILARNASSMTEDEKKELIEILLCYQ